MPPKDVSVEDGTQTEEIVARFGPEARAVSESRRFLRKALAGLLPAPGDADVLDTLVLAANELTTNAVLHARTEFSVRLLATPAFLRVEVSDRNSRMPQPCLTPADATSGRGLAIIDGTGLDWGAERHRGGKTVWVQGRRCGPSADGDGPS